MGIFRKIDLTIKIDKQPGIILAGLLLICIKYFWDYGSVADVSFVDEHGYLLNGIAFGSVRIYPESGPLYSLLYYLFHFSVADLPALQHTVTVVVSVACILSFFLLLNELEVPLSLSLFFTWCYLISPLFVPIFPKVGFLSNAIFFTSAIFFIGTDSRLKRAAIASMAFLFMTYIRPEFKLSLAISLLIVIFLLLSKRLEKRDMYSSPAIALVVLLVLLWAWLGNPFSDHSNRTYLAFGQHYALNKSKVQSLNSNPFVDWEDYNNKFFQGAKNIREAFKANPIEFEWHIYTNVRNYLWVISEYGTGVVWPRLFFGSVGKLSLLLFLLFFLPAIIKLMKRDFNFPTFFRQRIDVFLFCLLCWAPMIFGQLIVAPRHHTYAYQMMFPILIGAIVFYFRNKIVLSKLDFAISIVLIILFLIVTPSPAINPLIDHSRQSISIIEQLKSKGRTHMNVLDPIGACAEFTGLKSVTVKPSEKNEDFKVFIVKEKIDAVIVCPELTEDKRYLEDLTFKSFLRSPDQFGFTKNPDPISGKYFLYIKN